MELSSEFKDKKKLLTFFGVLELLMGAIILTFLMMALFHLPSTTYLPADSKIIISSLTFLVMIMTFFALGVGSIRARRWARSLSLLFSWQALIMGVFVLLLFVVGLPEVLSHMAKSIQEDPNIVPLIEVLIIIFSALFLIVPPGIFILVYQNSNVLKTVQKYDMKERWTDQCPLPLMILSLGFLFNAISPVTTIIQHGFKAPFFGMFVIGSPAIVLLLAKSAISIYLAIQIYKLNIRAWYYSLIFYLFEMISIFTTLLFGESMNQFRNRGVSFSKIMIMMVGFSILYFVFIFYTKKFFKVPKNKTDLINTP